MHSYFCERQASPEQAQKVQPRNLKTVREVWEWACEPYFFPRLGRLEANSCRKRDAHRYLEMGPTFLHEVQYWMKTTVRLFQNSDPEFPGFSWHAHSTRTTVRKRDSRRHVTFSAGGSRRKSSIPYPNTSEKDAAAAYRTTPRSGLFQHVLQNGSID